ncbi:hypothetical protein BCF55_1002 [Hydrogenivirga caldilitoris]|uniref:Tetratricopeptide repeat protein n=1 Tax=Hydrogenivirga caldilitoris TaxID=246264 RepID=A0A497XRA2_9AQUI|nr:tetratricopeptide repeat protein [Hydrogenivirga caldilitoris]RLJ70720.1 hypothetical protein BCF55_1002 [Hydrogenivirga caldilitoris]
MRIFCLLITAVLLFSCAKPRVNISYLEPPRRYEGGLKKLAVLPFESTSMDGKAFASELEAELLQVNVEGKPYFSLVSRNEIDKVVNELKFSSSGFTGESSELGRLLKAEGLLTGVVEYASGTGTYYEKRFRCTKTKGSGLIKECVDAVEYPVRCRTYELEFSMVPKLISVERGKILYSRRITRHYTEKHCDDYGYPPPSFSRMLDRAKGEAIRELIEDIAPHPVTVVAEFIDDDEGVKDRNSFEKAIELAEDGRVEEACSLFRAIKGDAYALFYNKGLCAELEGKLESAEELYRKALLIREDERIRRALNRVTLRRLKREKLESLVK